MAYEFDTEIAVRPGGEPGEWYAALSDRWRIGNGVHGGILMALGAAALAAELDGDGAHPDPVAFSAVFPTASVPGDVVLRTEVLRAGASLSQAQVRMLQREVRSGRSGGEPAGAADAGGVDAGGAADGGSDGILVERMRAVALFGDLSKRTEPVLRTAAAPAITPPHECVGSDGAIDFLAHSTLLDRMDIRLTPQTSGWAQGQPSGSGRLDGWVRFSDGREPDVLAVLWALDAMPPVAFDLGLFGWTPTLEFSAHLRAHPAPGWLQVELRTETVVGGLMEEDARIWDSTGRLVGQSRQLCGWRLPQRS